MGTYDKKRSAQAAPHVKDVKKSETPDTTAVEVLWKDSNGDILMASGTTVPTDTETGFAKGCLFIDTDVAALSSGLRENVGTNTSCDFNAFGGVTTLSGLSDTPANFAGAGDYIAKVNTGATALEYVAVSGDVSMSALGAMTVTDLTIASEAQGDLLRRGAATWERVAAKTDKQILIGDGTDIVSVPVTGDIAIANTGAVTVTGLTMGSDAQGDVVFRGAAAYERLAADNGKFLRSNGAAADPSWETPSAATATGIADGATLNDAGAFDAVLAFTQQTVGAPTLTVPDFASVSDEFVFKTLAQTLANKTLTSAVLNTGVSGTAVLDEDNMATDSDTQIATQQSIKAYVDTQVATQIANVVEDTTPQLGGDLDLNGSNIDFPTTANISDCKDEDDLASDSATMLATQQSIKAYVDSGTVTFTNKSFDCDGTGNALTNVNMDEMDPVTAPSTGDASDSVYGPSGIIMVNISNQGAAVNVFNSNAPFKFRVLKAYSVNQSADGGTWKLNNGAAGAGTDITNAVTVAASDKDYDEPTTYDDAATDIAASGSLSVVPDGGGALDCNIYIEIIQLA